MFTLLPGAIGCCQADVDDKFVPSFDRFTGERVTFKEAETICADAGLTLCKHPKPDCKEFPCDSNLEFWSFSSCSLQIKISLEGTVALVHSVPSTSPDLILKQVHENTKSFFRVVWSESIGDLLTDYDDMCDSLGCERDEYDNLCLCTAEVDESRAFSSAPTREQVLNELHIGAISPEIYRKLDKIELDGGVTMYAKNGAYLKSTIFRVIDDNGVEQFRKNIRSTVTIGSHDGLQLRFRNPLHMVSIQSPHPLYSYQETDAALDHYFVSLSFNCATKVMQSKIAF